jgi:hypothetical protein
VGPIVYYGQCFSFLDLACFADRHCTHGGVKMAKDKVLKLGRVGELALEVLSQALEGNGSTPRIGVSSFSSVVSEDFEGFVGEFREETVTIAGEALPHSTKFLFEIVVLVWRPRGPHQDHYQILRQQISPSSFRPARWFNL